MEKQHGGARENAGRKKKPEDEVTVTVSVNVMKKHVAAAKLAIKQLIKKTYSD